MKVVLALIGTTLCILMLVLTHKVQVLTQVYSDVLESTERNTIEYEQVKILLADHFGVNLE